VLAYGLDHGHFAGVPATVEVASTFHRVREDTGTGWPVAAAEHSGSECSHPAASSPSSPPHSTQIGSVQLFQQHCREAADVLPGKFEVEEVHALAIFDIRTLNGDRHGGNVLVCAAGEKSSRTWPATHEECHATAAGAEEEEGGEERQSSSTPGLTNGTTEGDSSTMDLSAVAPPPFAEADGGAAATSANDAGETAVLCGHDHRGGRGSPRFSRATAVCPPSSPYTFSPPELRRAGPRAGRAEAGPAVHLVPIDHSYICPSGYADPEYEWLAWPQAKRPFSTTSLAYIAELDAEADAQLVRAALLAHRHPLLHLLTDAGGAHDSGSDATQKAVGDADTNAEEVQTKGYGQHTDGSAWQHTTASNTAAATVANSSTATTTADVTPSSSSASRTTAADTGAEEETHSESTNDAEPPHSPPLVMDVTNSEHLLRCASHHDALSRFTTATAAPTREFDSPAAASLLQEMSCPSESDEEEVDGENGTEMSCAGVRLSRRRTTQYLQESATEASHAGARRHELHFMSTANVITYDKGAAEAAADVMRCTTHLLQIAALEFAKNAYEIGSLCRRARLTTPSVLEALIEDARDPGTWGVSMVVFDKLVREYLTRDSEEKDGTEGEGVHVTATQRDPNFIW